MTTADDAGGDLERHALAPELGHRRLDVLDQERAQGVLGGAGELGRIETEEGVSGW